MAQIKTEKEYRAIMSRIDELFFATDENTPADDSRLVELDMLSALVEEYEKEKYPIDYFGLWSDKDGFARNDICQELYSLRTTKKPMDL